MKIAIDCRYLGKSGIGRVCEGILDALDYGENEYYLIGDGRKLQKYSALGAVIAKDHSEPYSFAGLRSFDRSLNKTCDAYLTPNFLIPFGIGIPVHAVMHDLLFLDVRETTRGFSDRLIKKALLKRCMKKAKSVSCDSEFTLSRCKAHFGKRAEKCYVNYIGLSESVLSYAKTHPIPVKEDKIVYVGNVKPHKGLDVLLGAFADVRGKTVLKIIGERDKFLTGMRFDGELPRNVEFTGRIGDEELFSEIASAKYLVLPSKYEGFGLPPLEALVLGTQPVVSDIPVFREVYEDLPVKYFHTPEELSAALAEPPEAFDRAQTAASIESKCDYRKHVQALMKKIETR